MMRTLVGPLRLSVRSRQPDLLDELCLLTPTIQTLRDPARALVSSVGLAPTVIDRLDVFEAVSPALVAVVASRSTRSSGRAPLPSLPTSRPWRPSRGGRPAHPYGLLRHLLSTTWMSLRLPSLPGRAAQTGEGPRAVSVGRRLRPSRSARTLHASGRQVSHVQLHCGDSSRIRLQQTSLVKPTRDRR